MENENIPSVSKGLAFGRDFCHLPPSNLNVSGSPAFFSLPGGGGDGRRGRGTSLAWVSIWRRALTTAELWEIYAEGRANAKPLSAIVSTKICPAILQATLSSSDPYTVDLAWLTHEGLDSTGIEILLGNDIVATLAANATNYTHNPKCTT